MHGTAVATHTLTTGYWFTFPINSDPNLPFLFKGKTKPLDRGSLINHRVRCLHINVAVVQLFYGDYEKVAIKRLMKGAESHHEKTVFNVMKKVEQTPFSPEEIKAIEEADSPEQCSAVIYVPSTWLEYSMSWEPPLH